MELDKELIEEIREQLKMVGVETVDIMDFPRNKESGEHLSPDEIEKLPREQRDSILEKRRLHREKIHHAASLGKLDEIIYKEKQEKRKWVEEENERRYQDAQKNGKTLSPEQINEYMEIILDNLKNLQYDYDHTDIINVNVTSNPVDFDEATRYKEFGLEMDGGFDGVRYIPYICLGDITIGSKIDNEYGNTNHTYKGDSAEVKEGVCADFNMDKRQIVLVEKDTSDDSRVDNSMYDKARYLYIEIYEPDLELAKKYNKYRDYYVDIRKQEFVKKIDKSLDGKQLSEEQLNAILDGYDFTKDFDYPEVITTSEPRKFDDLTYTGINGVSYSDGFEGIKRYSNSVLGDTKFAAKNEHTRYEKNNPEADIDNSSVDADFSIKEVQIAEVEEYEEYIDRNYESTESKYSIIIYIPDDRVKNSVESYKELIAREKKESELKELMELEDKIDDLTKQAEQILNKDKSKELQTL